MWVFILMFLQLSQKGYRLTGMIQTGYSQAQLYYLKLKTIMKETQLVVSDREVGGQAVGWTAQASLVIDLVADQVDRVNRGVRKLPRW